MLISIEGLDGVGKTTMVSNISKALKIPTIEKPIRSLLELNPDHSKKIKEKLYASYSPSIQAMYYLFGYLSALEQGKNNDYILDRGFLSTYYFSYCKENANLFDFFAYNYGFSDLTILLYASIEERIKRISQRNSSDADLKRSRIYRDNYDKYFSAIENYNIPVVAINTENIDEIKCTQMLVEIINTWLLNKQSRQEILNTFSIKNLHVNDNYSYQINQNTLNQSIENKKIKRREKWKILLQTKTI